MNARPLETALLALRPNECVYVIRSGLAMPYPASLLRDIANDRYVVDDGPTPNQFEYDCGARLAARLATDRRQPSDPDRLKVLALTLWRNAGGGMLAFLLWWESVDTTASPAAIGTAAMVAARTMMTWSLFTHRCGIDVSATCA